MRFAPDAARYLIAAEGKPVARPFNLRWLLPAVCGQDLRRWWIVWAASWPALAGGMVWLAWDLGWQRAMFAAALCVGLGGLRVPAVRPVGVDMPAMALSACASAAAVHGVWWAAIPLIAVAASIKESAPIWSALWAWHPVLLVGLIVPAVVTLVRKPEVDEVTANPHLREIHDHPFRSSIAYRKGRWRDAWLFVAPWGACLAALYRPSWQTLAVVAVAALQLLVATDTVRLLHTAAGPAVAVVAATVLPVEWLLLIAVVHLFWWRPPEVI